MIEVSAGGRRARIWVDALPAWDFQVDHVQERRAPALGRRTLDERLVAIELVVPTGGRAYYGALAATFVPQDTTEFVARVLVSTDDGPVVRETLAGALDMVRLGLPEEYAEGVFLGLLDVHAARLLGAGTLSFVGARHGAVGSFADLFRTLGRILTRILTMPSGAVTEDGLLAIITEELKSKHA